MRQQARRQRELFEDKKLFQPPQLQLTAQQEVNQLLVQWMEALAKSINAEVEDDQDPR